MKRIALVVFLLFLSNTAFAEAELRSGTLAATPYSEPETNEDPLWTLRIGAKGALTGALWSEPDEVLAGYDVYWGDTQFFVGGGGGVFVEGNLLGYIGLEIDLLFEANSFTFDQTWNTFEYDYDTQFNQVRVPILIKGTLPLGSSAEMSLGLGPEFVIGTHADVEMDRRTNLGLDAANQDLDGILSELYQAEETNATFFDFDLGVGVKVWKLIIPISFRIGINLDQPSDHEERVEIDPNGRVPFVILGNDFGEFPRGEVKAVESYNFALMAGVGYVISP